MAHPLSVNGAIGAGRRVTKLVGAIIWVDTRRFAACGYVAYPLLCFSLIVLFRVGVPPETLSRLYARASRPIRARKCRCGGSGWHLLGG